MADLVRATGISRSKAYRLLVGGIVPIQVFAGTRYIRSKDIGDFLRAVKNTPETPS